MQIILALGTFKIIQSMFSYGKSMNINILTYLLKISLTHFMHGNDLFLYSMKYITKQRFPYVFRGKDIEKAFYKIR